MPPKLEAMAAHVPMPQPLDLFTKEGGSERKATEWRSWRQMWDAYATIVDLSSKEAAYQKSLFITCVGKDALPIVNSLPYAAESDRDDLTKILELLEAYCVGDEQVTFERYKFYQRVQGETESADEFIAALRTLVQTCNFVIDGKDFSRQMIRDRIVCGMRNNAVRRKLLAIADVGLDKCVQEIKSAEVAAGHAQKMDQCVKTRATEANLEKAAGQCEADVCAVQQQTVRVRFLWPYAWSRCMSSHRATV